MSETFLQAVMGGRKFRLGRIRKNQEKNKQKKQVRGPGRPKKHKELVCLNPF